jgi:PhzF family phenazine biosynthesis protein
MAQVLDIYQVDAFTSQLFSGNPAAVVPLKEWLPEARMQEIALENNLSETAFFVPSGKDSSIRWFTPTAEVDLCGHATLATAHVLWSELGFKRERLVFDSRSGKLVVEKVEKGYQLDFPADEPRMVTHAPPALFKGLGIIPDKILKGKDDYLVILENEEAVRSLLPDFRELAALGGRGLIVSAPGTDSDIVSRCFYPSVGVDEDPVTGSAHTTLTPYWSKQLGKDRLYARQISARGGELVCTMARERVLIEGKAVTYMKGEIILP